MNVTWGLLTVLSLACHTESRCSPTSYYKNCWIRRFPGIFIDIEESQRRGAQLLKHYQEETALKCSRTCCLTRNFSCNLAIFHYETTQENVNCFHLHCPTLESCILSHRGNVVLYNITKGVDPDLLVFGKYFTSNVCVLPHHYGRVNSSEPLLPSDKRQFIHPAPPPAALPPTSAPTLKPATTTGNTVLISPTTDTATLQITTHLSTVPTSTDALSSTTKTPTFSVNHAQTTTPTISSSTASLAPSFTTPPPASSTVTTLSPYKAETDPAFSDTTPQPSTLATSQLATTARLGNVESSRQYPNETKGSGLGRNHTAATEGGQGVTGEGTLGGLGPGWHVAAHTLLVAVAVCVAVLVSCCCSVLMVVSWRGQRKRMGRYRTSFQRKRGSMRLIKYVLVRERDS